ncbi:MAG: hypothetical protein M1821_004245 [Bathelium mastoideum]|nr:MAG: hypothetical protein M1821_004245 [Bathelium mastoideum]KAI9685367.1 MAG: hypothetical protein M1822_004498 [Bathelium mastoideum]
MPSPKPRAAEVATEAKKTFIPYIERTMPSYPAVSTIHPAPVQPKHDSKIDRSKRLRVAVIDGDPVDVALDWYEYTYKDASSRSNAPRRVPVINMANEKRPGGDWESGAMAPEECFARRSNLVLALSRASNGRNPTSLDHYPLPQTGGLYSQVVVFRDGPEHYQVWREFKQLPVISVAPVKRPKLDQTNTDYAFEQERDLMLEKMRVVLRIAQAWGHPDICLGAFGVGSAFRNPVRQVARMWKTLLFEDAEFRGIFANVVFAIQSKMPGDDREGAVELQVFQEEFSPSNVFRTSA